MSKEAMQMALKALEGNCTNPSADPEQFEKEDAAITALRQALKTEHEPVAHVYLFDKAGRPLVAWDNAKDIKLGDKLYAVKEKHI